MNPRRLMTLATILWGAVWLAAISPCQAADHPSVVVHFAKGKFFLSTADKTKIRELFSGYIMDAKTRIFILGYADSSGDPKENLKLSRQRANSVRKEIASAFGVDATIVMAMGKGEANPVADNRSAKGQALNRRAEIFLANARERAPKRQYGPGDPYLPEIQSLVKTADTMMRQGQLNQAILALKKAHAIGGDHYSDWNAAYGIAGYYANAPLETTRAHLDKALLLDPHNFQAREFLTRVDARQKVASGQVGAEMGRDIETPIAVSSVAQEHEYLRLFGAEPLAHKTLDGVSIDRWDCLSASGDPVVYYFDYSQMYDWGFAGAEQRAAAGSAAARPRLSDPPQLVSRHPPRQIKANSNVVWESAVFK